MSTAQQILDFITAAGTALEDDFVLYRPDSCAAGRLSLMTYKAPVEEDGDGSKRKEFKLDDELFERLRNKLDEKNEAAGNDLGDKGEVKRLVKWLKDVTFQVKLNLLLED